MNSGNKPRKARVLREEVKERHTSHWDLDYLPREEIDRRLQSARRQRRSQILRGIAGALLSLAIFAVLVALSGNARADVNPSPNPLREFRLHGKAIDEASGLARSNHHANLLWVHNDSGARPELHVIDIDGVHVAGVAIDGADAFDWEDMTSFMVDGESWLLIGDIGDNFAFRRSVTLYLLREPVLPASALQRSASDMPLRLTATVDHVIELRYEDGARDSEAIAVDPRTRRIYLLSKRDSPPRLYSLPLPPLTTDGNNSAKVITQVAAFETEVATLPEPTATDRMMPFGRFRSHPTAMDLAPDGNSLLIVTYKDVYRYRLHTTGSWGDALARPPCVIDIPQLKQTEAGAIASDGRTGFVISEQLPAAAVEFSYNCPAGH